jgi:hypothetical protein
MPVGNSLFDLIPVSAEALAKSWAPVAAPPHFQKVVRRGEKKEDCEENVVKRTHAPSALGFVTFPFNALPSRVRFVVENVTKTASPI